LFVAVPFLKLFRQSGEKRSNLTGILSQLEFSTEFSSRLLFLFHNRWLVGTTGGKEVAIAEFAGRALVFEEAEAVVG
jgi:hypothetical protein